MFTQFGIIRDMSLAVTLIHHQGLFFFCPLKKKIKIENSVFFVFFQCRIALGRDLAGVTG